MLDNFVHEFPQSNLHEQNLDWIISRVKELDIWFKARYPELVSRLEKDEYRIEKIEKWINDFDIYLLQDALAKYFKVAIFTEISESGYIIYNIPQTWNDITFNTTGLDINIPDVDYGHLALSY